MSTIENTVTAVSIGDEVAFERDGVEKYGVVVANKHGGWYDVAVGSNDDNVVVVRSTAMVKLDILEDGDLNDELDYNGGSYGDELTYHDARVDV